MVTTDKGDILVGYYDTKGNIILKRQGGNPIVLNDGERLGPPSGFTQYSVGNKVYALWREKGRGKKVIFLRSSLDGGIQWDKRAIVDEETEALTRIKVSGDEKGNLFVAWLGNKYYPDDPIPPITEEGEKRKEKKIKEKKDTSYHIYVRNSPDYGKTWGKTIRVTEGYYHSIWPALLTNEKKAYTFSWSGREGKMYIIFRKTDDGENWKPPVHIKEVGDVLLITPLKIAERLFVMWFGKYKNDGYILEGAYSEDDGKIWHTIRLQEAKGLDIGSMDLIADGEHVYLVFSARRESLSVSQKQNIYFLRSQDSGKTWEPLQIIRHYPYVHTNALYPNITADGKGNVAVVWNDYRNIRGDLYINYSSDFGKTWKTEDIPLSKKGKNNTYIYPFIKSLQRIGDTYYVLSARYKDDAFQAAELFMKDFRFKNLVNKKNMTDDVGSPAKISLLKKSAQKFWEKMVKGSYKKTYAFFDPFFRANFREVDYLSATGKIKYHSFQVKNVSVEGNIGYVSIEYEYEIPELLTKFGKYSRATTRANNTETWVYVDNKWLKEYFNEMGEFKYSRY